MFQGMDTEQARQTALTMDRLEYALLRLTTALENVQSANWHGPDAQAYREKIGALCRLRLSPIRRESAELAQQLRAEADAQDYASAPMCLAPPPLPLPGEQQLQRNAANAKQAAWETATETDAPLSRRVAAASYWYLLQAASLPLIDRALPENMSGAEVSVAAVSAVSHPRAARDLAGLFLANATLRTDPPDGHGGTLPARDFSQVAIQKMRDKRGETIYLVQIPPTESNMIAASGWWGQKNPQDWASNLVAGSGQESDSMRAVRAAMRARGPDGKPLVPPGAKIMLVGHSQGGLIAASLASDPTFNNASGKPGSYRVEQVLSAGSPVQQFHPARSETGVANLSHELRAKPISLPAPLPPTVLGFSGDPVPALDLNPENHRVQEISLPGYPQKAEELFNPMPTLISNHDTAPKDGTGYVGTLNRLEASDSRIKHLKDGAVGRYLEAEVISEHRVTLSRDPALPADEADAQAGTY
ncbi:GPI inositol-deacylase [Dermabacteraceae bacterium TAE3-ERU27]|nr:GPI inositol-deacylase [Dermabacteraceae bacterium TAE3-ERU27]